MTTEIVSKINLHEEIKQAVAESFDAKIIEPNSELGKKLGFTTEAGFTKDSYMYLFEKIYPNTDGIMLSLIICEKKGGFRNLMQNIIKAGYIFRIPNPSDRILEIAKKQGWNLGRADGCFIVTNEERK